MAADDWMNSGPLFDDNDSESIEIPLDGIDGLEDHDTPVAFGGDHRQDAHAHGPQAARDRHSRLGFSSGDQQSRGSLFDVSGAEPIPLSTPEKIEERRGAEEEEESDLEGASDEGHEEEGVHATGAAVGGEIASVDSKSPLTTATAGSGAQAGKRQRSGTQSFRSASRKNEISRRGIGTKMVDKMLSYPRVRLGMRTAHVFISKLIFACELIFFIQVLNGTWKSHQFLFAFGFGLLASPLLVTWAAMLIYCEQIVLEKVLGDNKLLLAAAYPMIFAFLIAPIGVVILVLAELFLFFYEMIQALIRLCCGWLPSDHSSVLRSTGLVSLRQFRQSTHMLAMSLPLLAWYAWIEYHWRQNNHFLDRGKDNGNHTKHAYLYLGFLFSVLNIIDTYYSIYTTSKYYKLSMVPLFLTGLRLFGGKVPVNGLANGRVTKCNWARIAFGSYSYAKISAVLESPYCMLKKVIVSELTLRSLNTQLCFHLGVALRMKKVKVHVIQPDSAATLWKHVFQFYKHKTTVGMLKTTLRNCDRFKHKSEEDFTKVANELDYIYGDNSSLYYYSDFKRDYIAELFNPLLVIHLYEIVRLPTEERGDMEKLLNLFLGAGAVNEIDPVSKRSPLFHAMQQLDHRLLDKLCDKGVTTSAEDWATLGQLVIDLVKDGDFAQLSSTLNQSLQRRAIDVDLDYRDSNGRCALHYAAERGNQDMCELLLACNLGCDMMAVDNSGRSAAEIARDEGHRELEEFLRDHF